MWKLVIETDVGEQTIVPLRGERYTIGRARGSDIRLTEQNVSRDHARVVSSGRSCIVEDLGSYNGTYVNAQRVAATEELAHGDLLQIGDYRIVLDQELTPVPAHPNGEPPKVASPLMGRPDRLVEIDGPTPGAEFSLSAARTRVGRAGADVSIEHNSVSRAHCELVRLPGGRFEMLDLDSANGVRVNGVNLRRTILEAGDVLELGDIVLKLVPAGEVFRLDRERSRRLAPRGAGRLNHVLPYLVFVGVLLVGSVIVLLATR